MAIEKVSNFDLDSDFLISHTPAMVEIVEIWRQNEDKASLFLIWKKAKEIWDILDKIIIKDQPTWEKTEKGDTSDDRQSPQTNKNSYNLSRFDSIEEAEKEIGFPFKCNFTLNNKTHHFFYILWKNEQWEYICSGVKKWYKWEPRPYIDYFLRVQEWNELYRKVYTNI